MKFDTQIIATAKAESATILYSDDIGIETSATRVGIRVMRVCDLPYVEPLLSNISSKSFEPRGDQLSLLPNPTETDTEAKEGADTEGALPNGGVREKPPKTETADVAPVPAPSGAVAVLAATSSKETTDRVGLARVGEVTPASAIPDAPNGSHFRTDESA